MHVKNGNIDQWRKVRELIFRCSCVHVYFHDAFLYHCMYSFGFWTVSEKNKLFEDDTVTDGH